MQYNRPISNAQAVDRKNECPCCKEKHIKDGGRYFWGMMTMPIRHRVFFFKVTLVLHVEVCYCPNCGLFGIGVRVR
ncbi:MAG: hypothetical protein K8T10_16230 [Candidatus Eremiobacteraeota bacterium]|nr:hypothetical protein [Candidatus Eremiobacteraeota bacterium]